METPYQLPALGSPEETRELFADHIFGRLEIPAPRLKGEKIEEAAKRKQFLVRVGTTAGERAFALLLYLPPTKKAPVFLSLNFHGNHTIQRDPEIALPSSWQPNEAARGSGAARWPVEKILAAGFGVATVYCGDFAPDHPGHVGEGILALANHEKEAAHRGSAIAAWAMGLRLALDALLTLPEIDAKRVAVLGHSRLGKAALWAGACDARFSLVISNDSGHGGAALFRRRLGESIADLNGKFPHWFAPEFRVYDGHEENLPVDQHQLLALMAPRALYVASASEDAWADPKGEYLALAAAARAWKETMPAEPPPPDTTWQGKHLGYHVRQGKHDITEYDWMQYTAFAKKVWKETNA